MFVGDDQREFVGTKSGQCSMYWVLARGCRTRFFSTTSHIMYPPMMPHLYFTVNVVLAKVWSLVPTLTANFPASTTQPLLRVHVASCADCTSIETVSEPPALPEEHRSVTSICYMASPKLRGTHGMSTFWKPANCWLGVTTELTRSVM